MIMSKEEFKDQLMSLHDKTHALLMSNGVFSDTALYAFLASADSVIIYAIMHIEEYKPTKDNDKDDD